MATITEAVDQCPCSSWEIADPAAVTFCKTHHSYRRGSKQLASVTSVIKKCWPEKPDFSAAPPAVLENARERGITVDELFSRYIAGTLTTIPAGTRRDAVDLFFRLKTWWDRRRVSTAAVQAQVVLADDDIAGTCDMLVDFEDGRAAVYDIKITYNLEPTYPLQLGLYGLLHEAEYDCLPDQLGLIHLTARFPEPKLIQLNVEECVSDARKLKDYWLMTQRRLR